MPTRRSFVAGSLSAGTVLAAHGTQKAAGQVDRRMIVDAQVHLWKAESPDWKWVPGLKPQLPEPFTIERLVPMMDEAGVDRVVIVPPSWPRRLAVARPMPWPAPVTMHTLPSSLRPPAALESSSPAISFL